MMPPQQTDDLKLTWVESSDYDVLRVVGELDVITAPLFHETISDWRSRLEEGSSSRLLVIDLTAAVYIDSTALGLVVGSLKRARASGSDLVLIVNSHRILRVFLVTRLVAAIEIYRTLDDIGHPDMRLHQDSSFEE